MSRGVTLSEHLLQSQTNVPGATGAFTRLLNQLIVAAKLISRDVNKAGLVDILGLTGLENVQGEQVRKLDDFANETIISRVESAGVVCAMSSEEVADVIEIPRNYPVGNYVLIFDPLDGSSNIDVNVGIGTIFSIFHRVSKPGREIIMEDLLQPGKNQVAAGYFVYGTSTMMVYSAGNGVHGFTLDPSCGEFLLSHENITIPKKGNTFSINEGNYYYWDEEIRNYIDHLKDPKAGHEVSYTSRYIGSLVSDFHRNLIHGGIFLYPADKKDPLKPNGKLRLMCEANPMAYVVEHAGGSATSGTERILDIQPTELHQRVPLIVGSEDEVKLAQEFIMGKRKWNEAVE